MLIGEDARGRGELSDLAVELAARSAGFRKSLPDGVLVVAMRLTDMTVMRLPKKDKPPSMPAGADMDL